MLRSNQEWMIEFWIFFDLCSQYRRRDVEQVYIAVQCGLAFKVEVVDVGPLLCRIRPPGYRGLDDGYDPGIGSSGLAFFNWIFDIELVDQGSTDYHRYRFTRKHDKRSTLVELKVESNPLGELSQFHYRTQLKKLEKSRDNLLVNKRYGTIMEF